MLEATSPRHGNPAQSPAPPRLGTTFRSKADLSSRGRVLPLPGRAPAPQLSLSNLGGTTQAARDPVGSRPRQADEHRGALGSGEEPSGLPAFPELRSRSAKAEVVRLTCPGCGAARRDDHWHRSVAWGASFVESVAGPGRGRSRALRGAFERAECGRRRRGSSRGNQAQQRTTRRRSVVRSSPSLPLRRRCLEDPGRSPRAATGPCEATGASLASRYLAVRTPELRRVPLPEQRARRALL